MGSRETALLQYLEAQQTRQNTFTVRLRMKGREVALIVGAVVLAGICAYLIAMHLATTTTAGDAQPVAPKRL